MRTMASEPKLLPLFLGLALGCGGGDGGPTDLLDPGASPPALSAELASMVADADQVDGVIAQVSAFANGAATRYTSFGVWPTTPMRAYVLCRRTGPVQCAPIDHPFVVDALPGEPGYSPFGAVFEVEVTDDYAGEVAPSFEAVDELVARGLALAPVDTRRYLHCPIVDPGVAVEVATGGTTVGPSPVYVRGMAATCMDFTATHGLRGLVDGEVLVRNVYVLRREGDDMPLIESMRGEDLTGDGDRQDTNNVFAVDLSDSDYTPLWRVVMVTVPDAYESIDTFMDETMATYTDSEQMFTADAEYRITPVPGAFVSYEETDMLIDCPLQSAPGAL